MDGQTLPIVAIVGQPNAGKSTLLNKIARKPLAVTSDLAGTTRDRQYVDTIWSGTEFTLVDTAGLSLDAREGLELNLLKQIEVALDEADIIIFVADGKEPVTAIDRNVLAKFRKIKKPLLLAINKADSPAKRREQTGEFARLGIKAMFAVSAINGGGIGDMLDFIVDSLKQLGLDKNQKIKPTGIAVSILGKPNVGKSSIFNAILKQERVVVSPIPGTTRTAIDEDIVIDGVDYTFIDTAGLKKKEHRQTQPDIYSGFQSFKAIRRSDVCFLVLDANEEVTKQDQRVASEIFAMQKGCIILANKIDLYSETAKAGARRGESGRIIKSGEEEYPRLRDYISHHFPFLSMCPVFFISAVSGTGLDEAISAIKPIYDRRLKTIEPEALQEFLDKKMKQNPPKLLRDQKKPKVLGLKQLAANPPLFELYVNYPAAISSQFRKFVENGIIRELDFYGTPITLKLRGKDKS